MLCRRAGSPFSFEAERRAAAFERGCFGGLCGEQLQLLRAAQSHAKLQDADQPAEQMGEAGAAIAERFSP